MSNKFFEYLRNIFETIPLPVFKEYKPEITSAMEDITPKKPEVILTKLDNLTLQRIQLLHPKLRDEAVQIYSEISNQLTKRAMCRFTFTLRTFAEQSAIYAQGRTKPGSIVTKAKAGQSLHNYGLAVDIAMIIDGKTASWDTRTDWDGDGTSDWMECVKVFKKYGWEWGGDWKSFKDLPHFQKTFGYTWQQLLLKHNSGKVDKNGYVML